MKKSKLHIRIIVNLVLIFLETALFFYKNFIERIIWAFCDLIIVTFCKIGYNDRR